MNLVNGPFLPGEVVVVGARQGLGKTTFALDQLRDACFVQNRSCLLVAPRASPMHVAVLLLAAQAGVNRVQLASGELTDDRWEKVVAAHHAMSEHDLRLVCGPLHVLELERLVQDSWLASHLDFLVIDDADAVAGSDAHSTPVALARLSSGLGIPVLVTATMRSPNGDSAAAAGEYEPTPFVGASHVSILLDRPDARDDELWPRRQAEANLYLRRGDGEAQVVTLRPQFHYARMAHLA